MAEEKKTTAKVIVPVKTEAKTEVKAEPVKKAAPAKKTAPAAKKTATAKATAVKAAAKAEVKKETVKKEPAKKAPAKKAAPAAKKTTAAKKEATVSVKVEFSGKSYTTEDLVNIAKDVWKYDLNGKAEDFKTVELYVKPEESTTYYVINGDVTGSFFI